MGKLLGFRDGKIGCWSRVDLESGEPVWVSVAQTGVIVKRSRTGLFGAKLYKESDIHKVVDISRALDAEITQYTTPPDMTNLVLRVFTQVALESNSAAQLCTRISRVLKSR